MHEYVHVAVSLRAFDFKVRSPVRPPAPHVMSTHVGSKEQSRLMRMYRFFTPFFVFGGELKRKHFFAFSHGVVDFVNNYGCDGDTGDFYVSILTGWCREGVVLTILLASTGKYAGVNL